MSTSNYRQDAAEAHLPNNIPYRNIAPDTSVRFIDSRLSNFVSRHFSTILIVIMFIQVLKGTALYQGPYPRAHYLWNYHEGFIKRGLVGSIAMYFADGNEYRILAIVNFISYLSYLTMARYSKISVGLSFRPLFHWGVIGICVLNLLTAYPLGDFYAESETILSKNKQNALLQYPTQFIDHWFHHHAAEGK